MFAEGKGGAVHRLQKLIDTAIFMPSENNVSIVSIDQTTFLKITCKESSPEDMSATNFIFILFFHMLMNVLGFAVPQVHGENNHCTITVHVEPNGSLK